MKRLKIALIPGDGIGREVVPAARAVLDAAGVEADYEEFAAGWERFGQTGTALDEETLDAIRACDGALFGAVSSPSRRTPGYASPILTLRKTLDLYANIRPARSAPVNGSQAGVDFVIVRENTECLYIKQEQEVEPGERVVAQRLITRRASARVTQVACKLAMQRRREDGSPPRLTIVHKANVLNLSDGLFRSAALDAAQAYPAIQVEEQLVDSMAYRMIREPQRYDVVVAPNLYGDILSDAAAALVGGLGLAPSANVGDGYVVAEPVHGSAPDIAGQGVANPVACMRAAALLIAYLGDEGRAAKIQAAVDVTLAAGVWTPDLGGKATTEDVTKAVCGSLSIR
jgi:homoisocitrate dehydrogenase